VPGRTPRPRSRDMRTKGLSVNEREGPRARGASFCTPHGCQREIGLSSAGTSTGLHPSLHPGLHHPASSRSGPGPLPGVAPEPSVRDRHLIQESTARALDPLPPPIPALHRPSPRGGWPEPAGWPAGWPECTGPSALVRMSPWPLPQAPPWPSCLSQCIQSHDHTKYPKQGAPCMPCLEHTDGDHATSCTRFSIALP
jgi:hypothetical protein